MSQITIQKIEIKKKRVSLIFINLKFNDKSKIQSFLSIRSTSREEYPNSLSYQPVTAIKFPISFAHKLQYMELWVFPIISLPTIGSSVNYNIPFKFPLVAFFIFSSISSF